jgi:predicted SnoaL-like aldol condensation-catalyzing enzyme
MKNDRMGGRMKGFVAGAGALLALGAALGAATPAGADTAASKQLVIRFFNFAGARAERAAQMLTPEYVQHNPRFLAWGERMGVKGADAWVKVLPDAGAHGVRLVSLGAIPLRHPVIVLVENDLVHAVYKGTVDGGREAYAFEAFRIRGDRFSEHWDQVRLAPGWAKEGPPLAPNAAADPGPPPTPQPSAGCSATPGQLAANKRLVLSARPARAAGYAEHSPYPGKARDRGKPDLVIADCDYVAVVWKTVLPDPDRPGRTYEAFSFDTWRIEGGKAAEHWDDAQD